MGNNQSTANRHHRLAKPKTNKNSLGLVSDSPASISSRYADRSAKSRYQIRETTPLSPLDTESGSGDWSKDEDAIGQLAPCPRGRPLSLMSRSNSRANSRANSRTNSRTNSLSCFGSRHGSAAKLSDLHDSKTSVATHTQVDLDTAIRLLQEIKKNGSPEDLAALHEAFEDSTALPVFESGLSRRTSVADGSCPSLTRRRSLVQTPGLATRNSPVEGRRRTWNSWKAPPIAPEEEAKWTLTSKGITPRKHLAVIKAGDGEGNALPRARTPSEMDYSHLGSLELGTLSIVNGAPSPAASAKIILQKPWSGGEYDYFAPPEAEPSPLMMKSTRRRHFRSKSSASPATAPLYDNGTIRPRTRHDDAPELCNGQDFFQPPLPEPPRRFRVTNTDEAKRFSDHEAVMLAQDYQSGIPSSPFVVDFQTNVQDQVALSKDEAAGVFTGTIFDAPNTAIETSGSVLFSQPLQNHFLEKEVVGPYTRPAPRTTDSGYSSGGSLRVGIPGRRSAGSTSSSRSSRGSVQEGQTPSPGLSHDSVRPAAPLQPRLSQRKPALLQLLGHSGSPSTSDSLLSPRSPCSVASKSSMDSTSSTTQKRLQRRRPSQSEAPVVQSCQSIPEGDSTVPDIPNTVRINFTRRISQTPGTDCLTHTYPSKDHVLTAEPKENIKIIVPTEPVVQLNEIEPDRPSQPPSNGRHRSLSLFRRKSVGERDGEKEVEVNASFGVVDLGTIASSLGSSPYDAAMSGPLRKTVTSPTHPHQLGAALPRAKSMVSMDSKAAAEWARMRSKDRALAEAEMPTQPPQQRQRRRSSHNIKMEVGEARVSKRRQESLQDIPPVPTIDASKLNGPIPAILRPGSGEKKKTSDDSPIAQSEMTSKVVPQLVASLEKQEQDPPVPSLEWDAHAQHWSRRRKSIGEGLRTRASFEQVNASMADWQNNPLPRMDMAVWGRYSGGLDYNHEGRSGVGGSAGTRSHHSRASSKSIQWRNQYGVDLSDLPIMLQRA